MPGHGVGKQGFAQDRTFGVLDLRIPEHPPTHSDNMRPPIPGYPPTCDALP